MTSFSMQELQLLLWKIAKNPVIFFSKIKKRYKS